MKIDTFIEKYVKISLDDGYGWLAAFSKLAFDITIGDIPLPENLKLYLGVKGTYLKDLELNIVRELIRY